MIVKEIEVPAGEAVDFGERIIDGLCVIRLASLKKRFLVTEVADVRAASGNHDRVGYQVQPVFDEVAADGWHAGKCPDRRLVALLRMPGPVVGEKAGPDIFTGTEEDRVGVSGRFFG